jgi:hypothetical protein
MAEFVKRQRFVAESTFITGLEKDGKIDIKEGSAKVVKAIAANPSEHEKDNTVIATSSLGNLICRTRHPLDQRLPEPDQIRGQIAQALDSLMKTFVINLLRNELIRCGREGEGHDGQHETNEIRSSFRALIGNTGWARPPRALADS